MSKRRIGAIPYLYPVPIVLIGAMVEGRANYATVGDCAIMGIRPPLVVVSLGESHFTTRGLLANRAFSINVPTTKLLSLVDHFGIVSGKDVDKAALVDSAPGMLPGVPLLVACPVNLECQVVEECTVEHRHMFIAKVVETHVDERFLTEVDGRTRVAPVPELDPILYALDNVYYSVGKPIGTGYHEGGELET
ncbi:flavin reductase family protein [Candidatus Bipolaricaulota bacterium]|nr:flavin reductase family protein [Candidatus Bipolaricaulota bacterium]